MRNNSLPFWFFIAGAIIFINVGANAMVPLIIMFFIASAFSKQKRRDNSNDRRSGRTRGRGTDYRREEYARQRDEERRRAMKRQQTERERQRRQMEQKRRRQNARPKNNPFKKSGILKYKEYDYDGAIEDFEKGLEINPTDVSIHFNLACCYSLNENTEKSFYHLSKAVALGFKDLNKIDSHDALAYLRIQKEFPAFKENGYRIVDTKSNPPPASNRDLLEQLNRLKALKDRGVLTEAEFAQQKEKLLSK